MRERERESQTDRQTAERGAGTEYSIIHVIKGSEDLALIT